MPTDKKILMKGIKYLGWALPLAFMGPVILHSSFKNQKEILFIPVLSVGIIICILSIYFMFRGINTIIKSLFD